MFAELLRRLRYPLWAFCSVVVLIVMLFAGSLSSKDAQAQQPTETWSDMSQDPLVTHSGSLSFSDYFELRRLHERVQGSAACKIESLPYNPAEPDQTTRSCWYDTSIGKLDENGYMIMPKGEKFVGLVEHASTQLIATPNPDIYIRVAHVSLDDREHYYLDFMVGDEAKMVVQNTAAEEDVASYTWPASVKYTRLLGLDGKPWVVDDNLIYSQIAYSNNGRFMAVWDSRGFVAEIDLNSESLVPQFAYIENVPAGESHFANISISNNGRFMAVAAYDDITGQTLRVVDFAHCSSNPAVDPLDVPLCSMRFLDGDLEHALPEDTAYTPGLAEFYNDDILEYYVTYSRNGYEKYAIRAPNTLKTNYIALGDSYASGEGEGDATYYPETKVKGLNICHLSRYSYPILLGGNVGLSSTHSVACSGATTLNVLGNGIFDEKLLNPSRTNQYSKDLPVGMKNNLGDWLPGYYAQMDAVTRNLPNIVTISIGGNNVGFKDILERCIGAGTCYGSYEDRYELVDEINGQFDDLVNTYRQLKQASLPDTRIYVIGYPSIMKPAGDCGWRQPITLNKTESMFAYELEDYLDSVIRLAAQKAGVSYVDTMDVFKGHRLCEGSANDRDVNGVTVGHDNNVVFSNGSFHPTMTGHEALAKWIAKETDNLTEPMPEEDAVIVEPIVDDSLELLHAEKTDRPLYEVVYFDVTRDVVYVNKTTTVTFKARPGTLPRERLSPFTSVSAVLHSDPVSLGTFMTDKDGSISAEVTIPDSIPPGVHAIDLYAMGVDGKMHDITQTIYVAASPTDYDGDGIPNDEESCVLYDGSGIDVDQDGIDDDCDEEVLPSSDEATSSISSNASGPAASNNLKIENADANIMTILSGNSSPSVLSDTTETVHHSLRTKQDKTATVRRMVWPWLIGTAVIILTLLYCLRYARSKS